ncbi:MAG: Single-stranded DNA-binding protein [Candidatus Omnitrophica bacterium]|nr:Single-stranded DNA-binding protein [Candidatus Omnitrophota bacterium]
MYQRLILVGNLGRDPELRYTPNGTPVTTMSVAVNRRWTDAQGTIKEETAWFRVITYGKQAEVCNQYLAAGRKVLVEGALVVDEKTGGPRVYQRKDGTHGASHEVRATTIRFLSPRGENPAASTANQTERDGEYSDNITTVEELLPF